MKIISRLVCFSFSCFLGIMITALPFSSWETKHQCPRFGGVDFSKNYFTPEQGTQIWGRRVRFAHDSPFPNNSGRVAGLDMIIPNKYFVIIDWDITPDGGEPGLRWYSRDYYESNLVEE